MSCSTKDRINTLLKTEIKGKATSYQEEKDRVFIPFNPNSQFIKKLDQAVEIAKGKVLKINEKYKKWANGDVVSVDNTPKNGVYINVHPTQALIDTYEADEQRKEVEEQDFQDWYKDNQSDIATEEEAKDYWKKCIKK